MPDYEEGYVRDQVLELYNWSENEHRTRFCNQAIYWYRYYKNYIDKRIDPNDYRSNIGVGLAFPIVEIVHARLMEPWLGGDYMMSARAYDEDAEELAPVVAARVNDVIQNRVTNARAKMSLVKKSGLLLGRGVLKERMRRDRPRSVPSRLSVSLPGPLGSLVQAGSELMLRMSRPSLRFDFDACDPFNVWTEPGVRFAVDDGDSWIFERSYMSTSQVYAQVEAGAWREPQVLLEGGMGYDEFTLRRLDLEQSLIDQPRAGSSGPNLHRIVEFQGRLEVKETRGTRPSYKDMHVVLIDEDDIAKIGPLDSWNGKPRYIIWEPIIEPCSTRPIGMIEPIEDMLLTINDFVNIALDNARKIIESPLLVDPVLANNQQLVLGPAAQNFVRNPRFAVAPLEMKDLPRSFFELLGWFNDLVQRISGVSDFFGGLNTSDTDRLTKTATGMSLMASLSASRFGPMLGSVDRDLYRRLAQDIHQTSRLYMPKGEMVRVPNPRSPFAMLSPADLDNDFEFSYNLRGLDPSASQRRDEFVSLVQALNAMGPALQQQGYQVNTFELARVLLDEFNRGQEVRRIITGLQQAGPGAPLPGMVPGVQEQIPGQPALPPGTGVPLQSVAAGAGATPGAGVPQ